MEIKSMKALSSLGSIWSVVLHCQDKTLEFPGLISPNTREGEAPWRFTVFDKEHTRGFGHIQLQEKHLEKKHCIELKTMLRDAIPNISEVEVKALTLTHLMKSTQYLSKNSSNPIVGL